MCTLATLLEIYAIILVIRLLLSWFPAPPEALRPVYAILFAITDPLLRLVRPLVPPLRRRGMALDLSPVIIFVLIQVLVSVMRQHC
jgi:YggT family protein